MSAVFKSPKIPSPPVSAPVKTPTIDTANQVIEQQQKIDKRRGKASTILTGDRSRTQIGGAQILKTVMGA